MKVRLLMSLVSLTLLSSCAAIEEATKKWKTPETANAGLAEGETSHYLLDKKDAETLIGNDSKTTKKAEPKKGKDKTKKK